MNHKNLISEDKKTLRDISKASILHGLEKGQALNPEFLNYSPNLQETRASFVTLYRQGELRGCIGIIEAFRPLIVDVAQNAFSAAFRDPRFNPLSLNEFEELDISISILSPLEKMTVRTENELIQELRPGIDGLVLRSGYHSGTYLPSVWEMLPSPHDFISNLKIKAGLDQKAWPKDLDIFRYTVEEI